MMHPTDANTHHDTLQNHTIDTWKTHDGRPTHMHTHTHSEGMCGLGWLIGVFSSGDSCSPQRQHTVSRSTLTSAGHTHTHSQTSSLPFSAEIRPPLPPSARFHLADSNSVLPRSNWLRYDAGEHSGECVRECLRVCVCVFASQLQTN